MLNIGGEGLYDSYEVIKANIYNSLSPKKSQYYLFIKDYNLPVMNKISNIYKLTLNNNQIYFDSNENLTKYVMSYIYNNTTEENKNEK